MLPNLTRRERAVLAAIVFSAFALFLIYVLGKIPNVDTAVVIAVLVLPVIIYLVVSGDVSEVSGPGGLNFKLKNFANSEVATTPISVDAQAEANSIQIVTKGSLRSLKARKQSLEPGKAVAMSIRLGVSKYSVSAVRTYAEILQSQTRDLTIIFVKGDGTFFASISGLEFLSAMRSESSSAAQNSVTQSNPNPTESSLAESVLSAVFLLDVAQLLALLPIQASYVTGTETNSQVLAKMLEQKTETLVSVDVQNYPVGIVRRDDIMARMLTRLAPPNT